MKRACKVFSSNKSRIMRDPACTVAASSITKRTSYDLTTQSKFVSLVNTFFRGKLRRIRVLCGNWTSGMPWLIPSWTGHQWNEHVRFSAATNSGSCDPACTVAASLITKQTSYHHTPWVKVHFCGQNFFLSWGIAAVSIDCFSVFTAFTN